jgi:hypothetical protein
MDIAYKNHFSKFSILYPLYNKRVASVTTCVAEFIKYFYPPKIIHCDNREEFKGWVNT